MLSNNELLESANLFGHYYGLSKATIADIQALGKIPITDLFVGTAQELFSSKVIDAN